MVPVWGNISFTMNKTHKLHRAFIYKNSDKVGVFIINEMGFKTGTVSVFNMIVM